MPRSTKPRRGRPALGDDKRKRLTVFLAPEIGETLERQARAEGVPAGRLAGRILEQHLTAEPDAR